MGRIDLLELSPSPEEAFSSPEWQCWLWLAQTRPGVALGSSW